MLLDQRLLLAGGSDSGLEANNGGTGAIGDTDAGYVALLMLKL